MLDKRLKKEHAEMLANTDPLLELLTSDPLSGPWQVRVVVSPSIAPLDEILSVCE
jgi:hypothetical protein